LAGSAGFGGTVAINANVTSAEGSILVQTDGNITASPGAVLTALLGPVTLDSFTANIGTGPALPVNTQTGSISINAASGSAWVNQSGPVTITGSAAGTLYLTASGTITTGVHKNLVSAADVYLTATSGGGITISGAVSGTGISGTNSISLTADGDIVSSPARLSSPTGPCSRNMDGY